MNVAAVLCARAAATPDRPAIVDYSRGRERVTTYAALEGGAARGAALLAQAGLRPGDPVLVFVPMSAELYAVLIAVFRLGLVPMFVDPSAGREHLERSCALVPPCALIACARAHALRLVAPALRRVPVKLVVGRPVPGAIPWSVADRLAPYPALHPSRDDDPALISFTSGSTGEPKVAVRTHAFLLAQHRALERAFGASGASDDCTAEPLAEAVARRPAVARRGGGGGGAASAPAGASLTTLPVFVLADLASGATSVIPPGDLRHPARLDPAPVLAAIAAHRPARAGGSPVFWERLVAHCRRHGLTLPHLRHIYVGGAPVFPHLFDALHGVAPEAEVVAVYGSTEAEPIAHIAHRELRPDDVPAMLAGRGLLAGQPVPELGLRILPDRWGTPVGPYTAAELDALSLPPGAVGEIVVSGAHVLPGYLDGRGDAETKFGVDGGPVGRSIWHRTGDAGYLDAGGRLWLLGRCAARLADARGALYPFAVECAAAAHPAVRRAALVEHQGRRLLAVERRTPFPRAPIIPRVHAGAGPPADLASLAEALTWADVDELRVVRHIPVDRRHNAKVDYPALRRALACQ